MRLGYLYSRYPVLSQTFCDTEMLELERRGFSLLLGSIHPPHTSLRHAHAERLQAPVHYAPPAAILRRWGERAKEDFRWPEKLIDEHERKYGAEFKPALRARNAAYFAYLFQREGVQHFHVHFANRAAHTALFLKEMVGIPFSVTAHGQDFMLDLGNDDLLREICAAAEFVAVETDYSRGLLSAKCPDSVTKIHRVYNGMDFTNFAAVEPLVYTAGPVRIVSIGRLVEFKGFAFLIDACAELKKRGLDFTCEIVGDGPLRSDLQARAAEAGLDAVVTLTGALPQQEVFERLRGCEVFALASTFDKAGASDVFPTVILEAMASARPVVSTAIAGIPEAVVHGLTGLVVPTGDVDALANALERLIRDQWLRCTFGNEGRKRIEQYFKVETTIAPLMALFERIAEAASGSDATERDQSQINHIAYVIDEWPDKRLPLLEAELLELKERNVAVLPFVCRLARDARISGHRKELATELVFLPDALVIEAEWDANRAIRSELEDDRANEEHRAPADIFLRQARFAVALRRQLQGRNISHVHATSSRTLLTAVMLKKLLGLTASATIEEKPELPASVIETALRKCDGGRVSHARMAKGLGSTFLYERPQGLAASSMQRLGFDLSSGAKLWQDWAELLIRWR